MSKLSGHGDQTKRNKDGDDDEDEHINVKSDVKYHNDDEVGERRCITRGKTSRQLDNIHGSTEKGSNTNKTRNNHTLIIGRSNKRKGEAPT